ncbi:MAG: DUF2155 domain-containing protein [Alphaproteobacteria bacterium]
MSNARIRLKGRLLPALAIVAGAMPALAPGALAQDNNGTQPSQTAAAILGALDKITGRVSEIVVPVGDRAEFFRLSIDVMSCQERIAGQQPESAVFLIIAESPLEGAPVRVFSGWMFASSPSISAMDHPIYDVWLVGCRVPGA